MDECDPAEDEGITDEGGQGQVTDESQMLCELRPCEPVAANVPGINTESWAVHESARVIENSSAFKNVIGSAHTSMVM